MGCGEGRIIILIHQRNDKKKSSLLILQSSYWLRDYFAVWGWVCVSWARALEIKSGRWDISLSFTWVSWVEQNRYSEFTRFRRQVRESPSCARGSNEASLRSSLSRWGRERFWINNNNINNNSSAGCHNIFSGEFSFSFNRMVIPLVSVSSDNSS